MTIGHQRTFLLESLIEDKSTRPFFGWVPMTLGHHKTFLWLPWLQDIFIRHPSGYPCQKTEHDIPRGTHTVKEYMTCLWVLMAVGLYRTSALTHDSWTVHDIPLNIHDKKQHQTFLRMPMTIEQHNTSF
jgi:hypothetical protein